MTLARAASLIAFALCGTACTSGTEGADSATANPIDRGAGGHTLPGAPVVVTPDGGAAVHRGPSNDAGSGADAAPSMTYPAAASDLRDRIGIYEWGVDYSSYVPGTQDRLTWGTEKVSGLGSKVIRLFIGPTDPYQVNPSGEFHLATTAAVGAYDAIFRSSQFTTYFLTAYTTADETNNWQSGFSAADAATETSEIKALTSYLAATYPDKTFILFNWEGDNAIASVGGGDVAFNGYVDWIASRAAGVVAGRGAVGHVYSGLEFNRGSTQVSGAPCDADANKCVASYVAPRVDVDYYSYSSWASLGTNTQTSQIRAQLTTDMNAALGFIQAKRPAVTPARMMLGEFGFARDVPVWDECVAAARAAEVMGFVQDWGAAYGVFWQIIDNNTVAGDAYGGFGLYKEDGPISQSGVLFQSFYASGTPSIAPAACPHAAALVNGVTYQPDGYSAGGVPAYHNDTTITLFGTFSAATGGNVVHIRQGALEWALAAGGDTTKNWYESATQINVQLVPGLVPNGGYAVVWATSNGLDSNGTLITILPPAN